MLEDKIISELSKRLEPGCFLEDPFTRGKQIFLRIERRCLKHSIEFLRSSGYAHLSGITALDANDKIELLYHLSNRNVLLTIRVRLPKNDVAVSSITEVIRGAILYEQEIHELFGVEFEGHPNLKPLILPDDWPNAVHPLRKDHPIEKPEAKKKKEESAGIS